MVAILCKVCFILLMDWALYPINYDDGKVSATKKNALIKKMKKWKKLEWLLNKIPFHPNLKKLRVNSNWFEKSYWRKMSCN